MLRKTATLLLLDLHDIFLCEDNVACYKLTVNLGVDHTDKDMVFNLLDLIINRKMALLAI